MIFSEIMKPIYYLLLLILLTTNLSVTAQETQSHLVQPGDSWTALAWYYGLNETDLRRQQMNPQREPAIGDIITLPSSSIRRNGVLIRPFAGQLLETALRHNITPWQIALQNKLRSPYHPTFYRPIFIETGGTPPRDLPIGMNQLELSQIPATPGQGLGVRGTVNEETAVSPIITLNSLPFDSYSENESFVALGATGAFFGSGTPELAIQTSPDAPMWVQPWLFIDPNTWAYQQITLTGQAAQIDSESIQQERERLFALWSVATPQIQWGNHFQLPISNYLDLSSGYGARRSYNGGPYSTYHEGVDFAAYGGTAVTAPASGTIVLAENLYVRGGAVIIDHGLGVYTGYYHLSAVFAEVGTEVNTGDLLGEVGTTGLSTGNHLHWDMLVADTWVDAWAWQEQGMGCWVLEGLKRPCQ